MLCQRDLLWTCITQGLWKLFSVFTVLKFNLALLKRVDQIQLLCNVKDFFSGTNHRIVVCFHKNFSHGG